VSEIVRRCIGYALHADGGGAAAGALRRRFFTLATGAVGGHVVMAAVTPVITRLYTPHDFAVIGIFVALLSVLVVASDGGYSRAVALPDSDETAASILVLSACITGVAGGATAIAVWGFKDHLALWTNAPLLAQYVWWLPVTVLAAGLYQVCTFWAIRRHAYDVMARTRLALSSGQALATVALGVAKVGGVGLIVGAAVGAVIGTWGLVRFAWRRDGPLIRGVTPAALHAVARRYAYFPLFTMPASLLQSLQTKIPILLIASFYGAHAAGALTFAHGVIWVLSTVISDAVAQVYLGRSAELARHDREDLKHLFNRTARVLLVSLAPPLVLFGMVAPPLFATVFGADWLEAGYFVRSLVPALIARLVVGPIFQTLTVLERQAWVFWSYALSVGLIVSGLVASHHWGWTADNAIRMYSAILLMTYATLFFLARKAIASVLAADASGVAARGPQVSSPR
jgi:O-antigen/teichoic acid export membrane protein